jgi:hypothetical protein
MIPASLASDPRDLTLALEDARALWDQGERDDALRCIRRAVDAADRAGQAFRVAALTRAFDSLCEARTQSAPAAHPESSVRPTPRKTLPGVAPSARGTLHGGPVSVPPPPPRSMVVPTSKGASSATLPSASLRAPAMPERAIASRPNARADARAETRVRVSVRISARDPELLVVRKLAAGAPVPTGAREAFLVIPDAGDDTEASVR